MGKRYRIISASIFILFCLALFNSVFNQLPLVATDFPYLSLSELYSRFSVPSAWWTRGAQGLGQNSILYLWFWPMDYLYGYAANSGIGFIGIERLLGIVPIVLISFFSISKLLSRYSLNVFAKYVGAYIYVGNTYLLLLVDGGQLSLGLAYAFLPAVLYALFNAYENKDLLSKFVLGISVTILGIFDIRYIYLFFLIAGVYAAFCISRDCRNGFIRSLSQWFVLICFISIIPALLFAYFIVPAFMTNFIGIPATYQSGTQLNFLNFTKVGHAILLLQPHWYLNTFGLISSLQPHFVIYPILAFLAPVLVRRNRAVAFWLLISVLGIFMAKGTNAPFGEIYQWMFTTVPGFSLFRDSTKFYVFVALSYSVLSAFTINFVLNYIKSYRVKMFVYVIISIYFFIITLPVISGKMSGMLSTPRNYESFSDLNSVLSTDSNFGSVLWIPGRPPLSYADSNHPSISALDLLDYRPFQIGVVGTYERLNYLREHILLHELLRILNISYLAYPFPDVYKNNTKEDEIDYYYTFLSQLKSHQWISNDKNPNIPLLSVNDPLGLFFTANDLIYVVGSDRLYNDLAKIRNVDLSQVGIVWSEEQLNILDSIENSTHSKILLYNTSNLDLLLGLADSNKFIFPSKLLDHEPDVSNWWKRDTNNFIDFRNFLQEKYSIDMQDFDFGGGWAISEGDNILSIHSNKQHAGERLFVRGLASDKGGTVKFYQDDYEIGNTDFLSSFKNTVNIKLTGSSDNDDQVVEYYKGDVVWREIGTLINDGPVILKTSGEVNVINAFVTLTQDEINTLNAKIEVLEDTNRVVTWESLSEIQKAQLFSKREDNVDVSYKQNRPSHYTITVQGVDSPKTIAFSQTYDKYWSLNYQSSIPLYGLINGFIVSQDGTYELTYFPQKYVDIGFAITKIAGIVILTVTLILLLRKQYKV
jgi:hypothetical protein